MTHLRSLFKPSDTQTHTCTQATFNVSRCTPAFMPAVCLFSVAGHKMPRTIFPIYMYAASKHAVTILTEGLRRELAEQNSNIRVTVSIRTVALYEGEARGEGVREQGAREILGLRRGSYSAT